jgi:uncharacterized protein (TIGR03083 family)
MAELGRVETLALFPAEREALLEVLGQLTPDEWQLPTACAGWSVHDIAIHLLWVDVNLLSRLRDGYTGRPGDTPVHFNDIDELIVFINAQNDRWIQAARRLSPRLVRDLLAFTGPQVVAYFGEQDPDELRGPIDWAGPDPAPVWMEIAREYTERWAHQQQIRDAVGRPGFTERQWFAPVLDAYCRAVPHTLRDTRAPEGTVVRLTIAGPAGGHWTAVRSADRWRLDTGHDQPAAATVTIDQDLAWRLFTKGASPETARAQARIDGDPALGTPLLSMVSVLA